MTFIYDNLDSKTTPPENKSSLLLTKDMSPPYQYYFKTFEVSKLYFDKGMEDVFLDIQKNSQRIFFEESKNNSLIQSSDIICGLFAGIAEQLQKFDETDFKEHVINKLKPNHQENLKILYEIYSKSEKESNGLFTHFFASITFAKRFKDFICLYK